jgi:microcystin-dependent protein
MAVGNSNTFVLPSQGSSIAISRSQFNSSLRSLLQNFYSTGIPGTDNLVDSGAAIASADYDGMLYRSATTGMFYVSDSTVTVASGRTNRPVGGAFTRYGIAWRQQGSLAAAAANISTFDVGEAFVVVQDTAGSSNNRMYMRVATTGTFSVDFVDVGQPAPGQVTAASLTNYSISGENLANSLLRATGLTVTPRVIIDSFANTQNSSTTSALELKGSSVANVSIGFTTSANSSIIKQMSSNAGLYVQSTNGIMAPIRANVFLQSTITGGTGETTAPLLPAGIVTAWAGASAPAGWQLCDGTALSRTTYAALFAVCSTTFGVGDNSTTFNVPDIRGRAIYGTSTDITRGATSTAIGSGFSSTSSSGGPTTHTVTTINYQQPAIPKDGTFNSLVTGVGAHSAHTHTITHPGISMNYIIKL